MISYVAPAPGSIAVVLEAIARGGKRGMKVATILPALIVEGGKLGELVEYDAAIGGVAIDAAGARHQWRDQVIGRGMPAQWIERLAVAIATEAIDRFTAKEAVEVLLQPK